MLGDITLRLVILGVKGYYILNILGVSGLGDINILYLYKAAYSKLRDILESINPVKILLNREKRALYF